VSPVTGRRCKRGAEPFAARPVTASQWGGGDRGRFRYPPTGQHVSAASGG